MAYNKKFQSRSDKYKPTSNDTTRVPMLNLRRINEFKYDIREALDSKQMDPAVKQTLIASVIAKASRQSIVEAKQYVRESQANGMVTKEVSDSICYLLDRYTKFQSQMV
ncbi:MAG: hypothetical protein A4E32_01039 [Methanomassiliicoccales archaeon PtaU1.Bin124]|nr:MAG: hypothetical protein A4E32_01039 [Methanomassiliicoccales archaeon PtaU1.Bin124]